MNELVFIENQQVVTDSLTIAEMFRKGHDNVLKDIRKQADYAGKEFSLVNFYESNYESRGKQYPKFNLTEEAFTLVVFSYNTKEAVQSKIKFIQEFKRMREYIGKQHEQDPITLALEASLETRKQVLAVQTDVKYLKETMRIDGVEQYQLNDAGKKKALAAIGGMDAPAYKELSRKVFAELWRDFKKHFTIPRYSELPKVKYSEGMHFISIWEPNTSMKMEIQKLNAQDRLRFAGDE